MRTKDLSPPSPVSSFIIGLVSAAALIASSGPARAASPASSASGLALAGRDPKLAPGDDFDGYANGGWAKGAIIPPDQYAVGGMADLVNRTREELRQIVESSAKRDTLAARQISGFYASYMDEARIEAMGTAPIMPDIAQIRGLPDRAAMARLMGTNPTNFLSSFFGFGVSVDPNAPGRHTVMLSQAGLTLPIDYYLDDKYKSQRQAYRDYVARSLTLVGWPQPDAAADAVLALETQVAKVSWSNVEQRDVAAGNNPMSIAELKALAPAFPWDELLDGAGLDKVDRVLVQEKSAFPKIADVYATADLETLKAWQASNLVMQASPFLPHQFTDSSQLLMQAMGGTQAQRPRWQRAVDAVSSELSDAVGQEYAATYFPPESKARMEAIADGMKAAMRERIRHVAWMSPQTKDKALEKLAAMRVMVGYPDKWRDISSLRIDPTDLYGNVKRANALHWEGQVARLGEPVDPRQWQMPPHVVNAYSDPQRNVVVFPAAILQAPLFDPIADPAVNYGAIGAVIGHEITHGFDDQGRQYDAQGKIADWWTPADAAKFKAEALRLSKLYDGYEVVPGVHVNGALTTGENIADLGGLLMALDAYHASLGGQPAPVIDGLTGDQRLFLAFAGSWRIKMRDETLRDMAVSDVHSPPRFRVNGVVRNIDAWYSSFNVKPAMQLYLEPDARVHLW